MFSFAPRLTSWPSRPSSPRELLLRYKRPLANLRVMCSAPEINPAAARLPPLLQTPSAHRHTPDPGLLLRGTSGHRNPLSWLQPRPQAKNRMHHPLDAVPHSMPFILGPSGDKPLSVISQHLLCERYHEALPGRSYPQLKLQCKNHLGKEWEEVAPDPARYPYHPSLMPHPFMGLDQLTTGRPHQMRSGKSSHSAHHTWDSDVPTTCPSCDEAPKTFEHAILRSPTKELARSRHLQRVSDIGPNAPVWSSVSLLAALARFISSPSTDFPSGMFLCPSSASMSVSSLSSKWSFFCVLYVFSGKLSLNSCSFTLPASERRVSFEVLVLISRPDVGLDRVPTPVEDNCSGCFLC